MQKESDWSFCVRRLNEVSRSFSLPIAMLEPPVQECATCGYLLCRIVDTIEDDVQLSQETRSKLFRDFLDFLDGKILEQEWEKSVSLLSGSPGEIQLARGMGCVLNILHALPQEMQQATRRWIHEMCLGMEIYSLRPKQADGIRALIDLSDLYRYCYFVAGTVGHLLTELFLLAHPHQFTQESRSLIVSHAESFGVGLQLVNILKDMAKDRKAGTSFIPRSVVGAGGFEHFFDPMQRNHAHKKLLPIFEKAYSSLDQAMEYLFAIPLELKSIRLFLLLPLTMAASTLKLVQGNDAAFDADAKVSITRKEVEELIAFCQANCQKDRVLKKAYATVRESSISQSS